MDRPILSLDRPFTYTIADELAAGVGSLVKVPFHGRAVRGWVLGPTDDVPSKVLPVRKLVSPVRFFDERMLQVLRWVADRYVAPLAAVIARSHPPRVAAEEIGGAGLANSRARGASASRRGSRSAGATPHATHLLAAYRGGPDLLRAVSSSSGGFVLRPAPDEEVVVAVELAGAAIAAGRTVLVLVPEASPLPATAAALLEAVGDRAVLFSGGDRRSRYRTWLEIAGGRFDCVVGTRPALFAPVVDLGLVLVARESHANHREERAPYYHVRDVALARARVDGATCVLSALCPSSEAAALGLPTIASAGRRWPPVEVVRPGTEGRAPRLVAALKAARRAFLYSPVPGYGVARVCRSCGEPARCGACGGIIRQAEGRIACAVCGARGRCGSCGSVDLGIRRGGAERVEEWAARLATVPVRRIKGRGPEPGDAVVVGGPDAVKDVGTPALDLVGILDVDLAERRPGLSALERSLATWMEAAAWAAPHGRVVVQASRPNDPAVQALVSGRPERFHRAEAARRASAGFPVGHPVFRVVGSPDLPGELERLGPTTLLVSVEEGLTLCLLALDPARLERFGRAARELAERDVVRRVEAEPHL